MSEAVALVESLRALPWVTVVIVAALAISVYQGGRSLLHRYVAASFRSAAGVLTGQLNQHEGVLAEHQHRLEVLRADLALTEGRTRKALTLIDEIREGRAK